MDNIFCKRCGNAHDESICCSGSLSSDAVLGDARAHEESTRLLKEIEAWLCFNESPDAEQLRAMRMSIKKHLSEHFA